jgi:hypothetical protein
MNLASEQGCPAVGASRRVLQRSVQTKKKKGLEVVAYFDEIKSLKTYIQNSLTLVGW